MGVSADRKHAIFNVLNNASSAQSVAQTGPKDLLQVVSISSVSESVLAYAQLHVSPFHPFLL